MATDPDQLVEVNGVTMAIKDIPDPSLRHLLGLGHFPNGRPRIAGDWPYTPETCIYTDDSDNRNEWIENGTVLVCTGCGSDGT